MPTLVTLGVVTIGLAGLGFAALLFAGLAVTGFVRDWFEVRRARRDARALGPFRDAPGLQQLATPQLGAANYLVAAAVIVTLALLLGERQAPLRAAAAAASADESRGPERLLAGDPELTGIGHVVRMSAPLTGVGGERTGDVIRIVAHGAVAIDPLTHLAHVSADIDRASVENRRDHAVIEIRLVPGRRPRWNVEAVGDCLVIHLHR